MSELKSVNEVIAYAESLAKNILFSNENCKVIQLAFGPEQGLPKHQTNIDALLMITEGTCQLKIFEEEINMNANDFFILPANEPHELWATGDGFKMLLIR